LRPSDYRPQLRAYLEEALQGGGQTPHVLEKALSGTPAINGKGACW
jgi:acyl-CoA hydrolase